MSTESDTTSAILFPGQGSQTPEMRDLVERVRPDLLALFDKEKVKGIIMDLRGDPGGLYEQAQRVADAFVKTGTLVSMVVPFAPADAQWAVMGHADLWRA